MIGSLFHYVLEAMRPFVERGIAVVRMTVGPEVVDDLPIDCLYVDNFKAAYTATNYLIGRQHTRIAMIAGQESPVREQRVQGYRAALLDHHLGLDDIPAARLVTPALTTINQFAGRLGQRAAQMIFERLADPALGLARSEEM